MQAVINSLLMASTRGQAVSPPATFAYTGNPSDGSRPSMSSAPNRQGTYKGASPAKWNTMIGEKLENYVKQCQTDEFTAGIEVSFPISKDKSCAQNLEKKSKALSSCHEWDVAAANIKDLMKPLGRDKLPEPCTSNKDGCTDDGNNAYRRLAKRLGNYMIKLSKVPSKTALQRLSGKTAIKTVVLRYSKESDNKIKYPKRPSRDSPTEPKRKVIEKNIKDKKKPKVALSPDQSGNDPGLPGNDF